ncbi:hypothetical protein BJY04DRAFT_197164 [Aspergillus karnatakaensis]|uniref:uncharacterized protein n=1 Tax=Aspergillus karnatakaensis TaxID=1810916 RepID=UPI003CCDA713
MNYASLRQRFGVLQALMLTAMFPDARQIVERIEKHILGGRAEEALSLQKSTSEDCTMLAVAAAIVAQVAITALGLEDLNQVHWSAQAAFVMSLTAGGLSVFYACLVQRRMSSFFTAEDVKDFFSRPSSSKSLRRLEHQLELSISELREPNVGDGANKAQRMGELKSMLERFRSHNRWRIASFHSILMVKAPTVLLKYALGSFIIGLGIYFGCLAFNELDSQRPRESYRRIFGVYIATSVLGLLVYYAPSILKDLEQSRTRRYAKKIDSLPEGQNDEEIELIRKIKALLNPNDQETSQENDFNDAISWEGRLEDINRPQSYT